jgi:glycosyltransferase 2 family protein
MPVLLVATIPLSIAGWGTRETAMVLAFGYAGLPETDGLIVSVLLGITTFAAGLPGGVIWILDHGKRVREARQPVA